jgi:hypothetical protein
MNKVCKDNRRTHRLLMDFGDKASHLSNVLEELTELYSQSLKSYVISALRALVLPKFLPCAI